MVYSYFGLISVLACLIGSGFTAKFPSNWMACKLNDPNHNECLRKAIQGTLPDLLKGMPKLNLRTIDPLQVGSIDIKQGNGPVSINLNFKDLEVHGIKNGIVQSVKNDKWKTLEANVTVPSLLAKGSYSTNGKILVLPITGEGPCELRLEKFFANVKIKFSETTKNGKQYYHVEDFKFDLDCNPIQFKLDNLFNGNKQLGDQMNLFLNENWKLILKEIKPSIDAALGQSFFQLATRLFSKIPKNEITPP